MGAEQIGFIAKGPAKIPPGRIKAAVRACRRWRKEALDTVVDLENEDERRSAAYALTGEDFDPGDIPENPEPGIREFVEWWRHAEGRDTCSRRDPDDKRQMLVYAGDMSDGGEPDGHGYQMLKKAFAWGFAEALGIR